MMTAESMFSKRPVFRFTVALLFLLKLFSSCIYCFPKIFYAMSLSKERCKDPHWLLRERKKASTSPLALKQLFAMEYNEMLD